MDVPLFYVMLSGPSPILNIQYVTKINLNLCTPAYLFTNIIWLVFIIFT